MLQKKYSKLKQQLAELGSICVAFSGGVDSTLLLYVAQEILGEHAMGITVRASMHSSREMVEAAEFVAGIGVKHFFIKADEYSIPEFVENGKDRCYHCKKAIFTKIKDLAGQSGIPYVADGSIADDVFDYRPGMIALKELEVISPLKDAGFTKQEVRLLSKQLKLPTWSKPSMACLASRIPYGVPITPEKLGMVEKGELYLLDHGFTQFRVRHHGDIARIEIIPQEQMKFLAPSFMSETVKVFKDIGFTYVTLDLGGYRVGSMNEVLTQEDLDI
ncbi:MAG TPA: ATP-dependent sacrificial sulfur transferase LarE [Epulopiscium sp.]|nr:ATP-dependent sacrificial sulfur transferase LarE [Candidatus Epulonipiscium sp.]